MKSDEDVIYDHQLHLEPQQASSSSKPRAHPRLHGYDVVSRRPWRIPAGKPGHSDIGLSLGNKVKDMVRVRALVVG